MVNNVSTRHAAGVGAHQPSCPFLKSSLVRHKYPRRSDGCIDATKQNIHGRTSGIMPSQDFSKPVHVPTQTYNYGCYQEINGRLVRVADSPLRQEPLRLAGFALSKPVQHDPMNNDGLDPRFGYKSCSQTTLTAPKTAEPVTPNTMHLPFRAAHPFVDDDEFAAIWSWIPYTPPPAFPKQESPDAEMRLKRSIGTRACLKNEDGLPAGSDFYNFSIAQRQYHQLDEASRGQKRSWIDCHTATMRYAALTEEMGNLEYSLCQIANPQASPADRIRFEAWDAVEEMAEETSEREACFRAAAFSCAARLHGCRFIADD